jgi:multidrug transporter EmrE-like cation transporter
LTYLFIAGTVLFTVYGQLILKWRLASYGPLPEQFLDKGFFLFRLFLDPFILSGFFAAFIASLFWMAAMTKADLSFAYPIISAGLVILTTTASILLLGESITPFKALGIALIVCGVIVMFLSGIYSKT